MPFSRLVSAILASAVGGAAKQGNPLVCSICFSYPVRILKYIFVFFYYNEGKLSKHGLEFVKMVAF